MAYRTSSAQYNPLSFEQILAPYKMYSDAYTLQEEKLQNLYEKSQPIGSRIDKNTQAYSTYSNYTNELEDAMNELYHNGLSTGVSKKLSKLNAKYNQLIKPIEMAQEDLEKFRDTAFKMGNRVEFRNPNYTIDDFMFGNRPDDTYTDLDAITKDTATQMSSLSKNIDFGLSLGDKSPIYSSAWNDYYDVMNTQGVSAAVVAAVMNDDTEALESLYAISPKNVEAVNAMRSIATNVMRTHTGMGYNEDGTFNSNGWSASSQMKVRDAINAGMHAAMGTTTHQMLTDNSRQISRNFALQEENLQLQREKAYAAANKSGGSGSGTYRVATSPDESLIVYSKRDGNNPNERVGVRVFSPTDYRGEQAAGRGIADAYSADADADSASWIGRRFGGHDSANIKLTWDDLEQLAIGDTTSVDAAFKKMGRHSDKTRQSDINAISEIAKEIWQNTYDEYGDYGGYDLRNMFERGVTMTYDHDNGWRAIIKRNNVQYAPANANFGMGDTSQDEEVTVLD